MKREQSKKIFTRMLINNWGGIDHQVIQFHEHVNLFSGKSGSGKSTVMDAMQVVLYGSVRNDFLNRAADDTKNKRSVLSYLRGEQKDGTANRENQDFYSQIVLEIKDTGSNNYVCIGTAFEVARGDQDLKRFWYFSHVGQFPEDEYLSENRIPYSHSELNRLIRERSETDVNRGHANLNRIYPSQESYINTLNDVIFGYVDAGRFKTMQKSAIALRMTNGTGQFIKDYMFPKSKEDTISALSEQLAAYREIKEQVETLEKQIELLDEVRVHDRALTQAKSDQIRAESLLRILDMESVKAHIDSNERDFENVQAAMHEIRRQKEELHTLLEEKRDALAKIQAELKSTELEQKKEKLEDLNKIIQSCSNEAADWRKLVKDLKAWEDTEGISERLNNWLYNLLDEFDTQEITEELFEKLKRLLNDTYESVIEELDELKQNYKEIQKEYQEKQDILKDLKSDKKHYKKELKDVRRRLESELSNRYGRTIRVEVLADLFDIIDEDWRNAIEGRLGRIKFGLVVEPRYALDAAKIFRQMKKEEYETVDLINTAAILRDKPEADRDTLYEAVTTEIPYVDLCLKRYLGRICKCENVEELNEVKDGVTKDCYSYSNYMFRHLRQKDYKYASIGKKISQKQIRELEEESFKLSEELISVSQEISTLQQVNDLERLQRYEYEKVLRLSKAGEELKKRNREADKLQAEIRELEQGTYITYLKEQEQELQQSIHTIEVTSDQLSEKNGLLLQQQGRLEIEIRDGKKRLEELQLGFVPNQELLEEAQQAYRNGQANECRKKQKQALDEAKKTEGQEQELRGTARAKFNRAFPSYDFGGMEQENTVYDELLERFRKNFEPEYKAQFDKQYRLVYQMLRENVIATIHGEIKAAKRHRREINAMLAKIRFSDSIYQIDILPTDDENRQFYEMLTAEELDTKVIDTEMEGQLSFGEDLFYQKYEMQIQRLTDKFMPPREEDQTVRAAYKKDMEKYADYRTYLKFSMYEQAVDADGNVKKNYVDDMAGRDSGGEGQNPKYVALLAGFAMLYNQQSNRESKIRLVMLDEAFSKMDKERSEVCLHYARQLGLQLVVCVPDERLQSLIRNVDCVYAFRRANNRISMIHIDKGQYFQMIEGNAIENKSDAGSLAHR